MAPFISPHAAGQRYRGLDYSPRSEFGEPRAQFRSPRRGCRQPARWPIALSSLLHHAHGQWAVCVGREYALPTLREPIPFPGHPPGVIPRQSRNVWTKYTWSSYLYLRLVFAGSCSCGRVAKATLALEELSRRKNMLFGQLEIPLYGCCTEIRPPPLGLLCWPLCTRARSRTCWYDTECP